MSRLGRRLDDQYHRAVSDLLDALDAGEMDAIEWAEQSRELTASYEQHVDTVAEELKEYGWR